MSATAELVNTLWTQTDELIAKAAAGWVGNTLFAAGLLINSVVTLWVIFMGWRIVLGKEVVPGVAIQQVLLVTVVIFAVGSNAMYLPWVVDNTKDLPLQIVNLMSNKVSGTIGEKMGEVIDPIANLVSGSFGAMNIGGSVLGGLILVFTAAAVVAATGVLLVTKIGLSVFIALGPFVLIGLLFGPFRDIFSKWLGYIITLTLTGVIVLLLLDIAVDVSKVVGLEAAKQGVKFSTAAAVSAVMGGMAVLFALAGPMASTIGGGIGTVAGAGIAGLPWAKAGQLAGAGKAAATRAAATGAGMAGAAAMDRFQDSSLGVKMEAGRQIRAEGRDAGADRTERVNEAKKESLAKRAKSEARQAALRKKMRGDGGDD